MNANDVLQALAARHHRDVFVPECKSGDSGRGMRAIDAWVMRKSWSKFSTIGYEIKVSRGDFLRDEKWPDYLPMCHELNFACPWNLIQPEELPEGIGLLWMNRGGRLVTKRKAVRRDIESPWAVFVYILMWRADTMDEGLGPNAGRRARRIAEMRQHVENAETGRELAMLLSHKLRRAQSKRDMELADARRRADDLEAAAKSLRELGIDPGNRNVRHPNRLKQMIEGIDPHMTVRIDRLVDGLTRLSRELKE